EIQDKLKKKTNTYLDWRTLAGIMYAAIFRENPADAKDEASGTGWRVAKPKNDTWSSEATTMMGKGVGQISMVTKKEIAVYPYDASALKDPEKYNDFKKKQLDEEKLAQKNMAEKLANASNASNSVAPIPKNNSASNPDSHNIDNTTVKPPANTD